MKHSTDDVNWRNTNLNESIWTWQLQSTNWHRVQSLNLKSFKGSTGLSNTPHHQDYRKDMVWGQFNRTFTSEAVFLDSASNSFTSKLPLVVMSFLRSGALVSGEDKGFDWAERPTFVFTVMYTPCLRSKYLFLILTRFWFFMIWRTIRL